MTNTVCKNFDYFLGINLNKDVYVMALNIVTIFVSSHHIILVIIIGSVDW